MLEYTMAKITGITILFFVFLALAPQMAAGEVFEFRHTAGDRYRILSVVRQDVFINRRLSHRAEILNRIAVEVLDVIDGKGLHRAIFQTSERILFDASSREVQAAPTGYLWAREYESFFKRDRLGNITIEPQYFMPVVRNVPVFPGRSLRTLERWRGEGYAVHDFRDAFGIAEPYRIPFTANYQFIGEQPWRGVFHPAFSINFRIDTRPPPVQGYVFPVRIRGNFNQTVFWDRELGQAIAYNETFSLAFDMSDGRHIEFRGTAEAEFIDSEDMNREQIASDIIEEIERLEIPDVTVRAVDEGVLISLDDIRFFPDSAVMLPGEEAKLEVIAEILRQFPDRDIKVSGHAALAGRASREELRQLSVLRAAAVAHYFITENVRTADRIVIRGYGVEMPVADNITEEGRQRNRRVEIILLEN